MRNIKITDKADKAMEQGGNGLIWFIPLFLFCAWLTYTPATHDTLGFYPASYHPTIFHPVQHNPILTLFGWELL